MAFMAQPSFLIAPDSSGHQFYSAHLFTCNPLTNQLDRLVILQTGVRDGATTSTMTQTQRPLTAPASSRKTSAGRSR